jgi:hypothetical protein
MRTIIFMSFVLILTGPMIARTDLWVGRTAKIDTQVLMYSSTGNERFKIKVEGIVPELAKIQQALASRGFHAGYLSAFPFDRVGCSLASGLCGSQKIDPKQERITVKFQAHPDALRSMFDLRVVRLDPAKQ